MQEQLVLEQYYLTKMQTPVEISQYEFNQFFPKEGWVEHDPISRSGHAQPNLL